MVPVEAQGKQEKPLLQTCVVCEVHIASSGIAGCRPVLSRLEERSLQTCGQKDVSHISSHFSFYDVLKFSVCFSNFPQSPKVTQSHFVIMTEIRQARS